MNDDTVLVRKPAAARRLVLLFHGVGATPQNLLPLADAIAQADPAAWVVSVRSPEPCDFGIGWQWFSVRGVTEENRLGRVAAAMPQFVETVQDWQRQSGVGPDATTLVGFSQGAIMALESTQLADPLASQVIAIAGRFAQPPKLRPAAAVHLVHGEDDTVIDPRCSIAAADRLASIGAEVGLNLLVGVGHTIDAVVVDLVCAQLRKG